MVDMRFPQGFLWGTATSAYQIEGGSGEDGKGMSIWDKYVHTPGNVKNSDTGDIACDHYHRYAEDVQHMKNLGVKGYRFSISWTRVFPNGYGKPNGKGMDFYSRLVDTLLEADIMPMPTLYHWDLPQALQDEGGWVNRTTAEYFGDYAYYIFNRLGDRVSMWLTHNEPWVVTFPGHFFGTTAPALRDLPAALQVAHHLLLSHGKAVAALRATGRDDAEIGIALCLVPAYTYVDNQTAIANMRFMDGYVNRWFLDPVFKGYYPEDMWEFYRQYTELPEVRDGDMQVIGKGTDFLGINYYVKQVVDDSDVLSFFKAARRAPSFEMSDVLRFEFDPEGIYDLMHRLQKDYGPLPMYITENGCPFDDGDYENDTKCDYDRITYLREHIEQVHRAVSDGLPIKGYFVWTFMDNFEWDQGYTMKYGLMEVNRNTLQRRWKRSAWWYKDVIASNGI